MGDSAASASTTRTSPRSAWRSSSDTLGISQRSWSLSPSSTAKYQKKYRTVLPRRSPASLRLLTPFRSLAFLLSLQSPPCLTTLDLVPQSCFPSLTSPTHSLLILSGDIVLSTNRSSQQWWTSLLSTTPVREPWPWLQHTTATLPGTRNLTRSSSLSLKITGRSSSWRRSQTWRICFEFYSFQFVYISI